MNVLEEFAKSQVTHIGGGYAYLMSRNYSFTIDLDHMNLYYRLIDTTQIEPLEWKPHPLEIPGCYLSGKTYKIRNEFTYVVGTFMGDTSSVRKE